MAKNLYVFFLILFTLIAPDSINSCEGAWYKLFPIYLVFFIFLMFLLFKKNLKKHIILIISTIGFFVSFLVMLFPGKFFLNLLFPIYCPDGSYWGDKLYYQNLIPKGPLYLFGQSDQTFILSFLMLLYCLGYGFFFYKGINKK